MEPYLTASVNNVVFGLLLFTIPVLLILLGVALGLRLNRMEAGRPARERKERIVLLLAAGLLIVVMALLLVTVPFLLPLFLIALAQVAVWGVLLAVGIWLILWLARRMGIVGPARESALDILKARYARGEITQAQFEEMKQNLSDR
jgi:uncharacterized membrane protein